MFHMGQEMLTAAGRELRIVSRRFKKICCAEGAGVLQ